VTPQNWQTVMTKKVASFSHEKIGVTPSVAAPGDTHPSDATPVKVRYFILFLSPAQARVSLQIFW